MRRGAFDLVDQAEDVSDGETVKAFGRRPVGAFRLRERREQPIERLGLAEEEEFVFAAKVVIQIARRQRGGARDIAHAGRGKSHPAKRPGGGSKDLDAPGIGTLLEAR